MLDSLKSKSEVAMESPRRENGQRGRGAVIQDADGIKLQVDVVGLDLTALIDTRQVIDD
jgi:hypothetical protein